MKLYYKNLYHQFPLQYAIRLILSRKFDEMLGIKPKNYYSQTGEDIIIKFLLDEKPNGFYVDIGCNDPINYSNTLELYRNGWRGINVDANPKLIKRFKFRRNDISICEAVSDTVQELEFHEFKQSASSTLDTSVLEEWKKKWDYIGSRKVVTKTLTQILDENNAPPVIDFLSIDVEGHDFQVLRSLDFNKYKPTLILIEIHNFNFKNYHQDPIVQFLDEKGYDLIGYAVMNGYFKLRR